MRRLIMRKATNLLFLGLCTSFAFAAVVPLFSILHYVMAAGVSHLNLDFFTKLPGPAGEAGGGMANAILGTLYLVGIACITGIPVGLMGGIYLSEYGRGKLATAIRFSTDVLSGVPSIVVGIFVYTLLVVPLRTYSALAGGIALAIIMIPVVTRTTEEMLRLVPDTIREASLALGAGSWRTTFSVVLPAASGGIITGIMLAISRAAGETAPLLFTALSSRYWPGDLLMPTASLPVYIFNYSISPFESWHNQAWAAASVLVGLILLTNILARIATSRLSRMKG